MKKCLTFSISLCVIVVGVGFGQMEGPLDETEMDSLINPPQSPVSEELVGLWEVNSIYDKFKPFEELYPGQKPRLYFDPFNKQVFGYTGCNNFSIFTQVKGNAIDVQGFLTMTKMWCDGDGEDVFLTLLKSAHTFSIDEDGKLSFLCGSMEIMKLEKVVNEDNGEHPFILPMMMASGHFPFKLRN